MSHWREKSTVVTRPAWVDWPLIDCRRPTPDVCSHGRPDHQVLLRQLAESLGMNLPAIAATPEQVWNGLLDEIEAERD